jgi:hypothetical protein
LLIEAKIADRKLITSLPPITVYDYLTKTLLTVWRMVGEDRGEPSRVDQELSPISVYKIYCIYTIS